MVDQVQESKRLSDDELKEAVETFREQLKLLNVLQTGLLRHGLAGYYYIGQNSAATYLPDRVIFKRTTTETF